MNRPSSLRYTLPLLFAAFIAVSAPVWAGSLPAAGVRLGAQRLWVQTISPNADSAPAYLPHVRLPSGARRAVVYATAGNNASNCNPGAPVRRATTYAFDAASGKLLWRRSTSGPSRCTTAGPVVDPNATWVYAPGLDGKMHRYNAATGAESFSQGWPQTVTLMPNVEKMSATPTIGSGHLYATTSGFIGDQGHYQGHMVSVDLSTGRSTVFNSLCSDIHELLGPTRGQPNYCSSERSGLFGRGQGAIDPVTHAVYIVTGNGDWNGRTNWGDSVLKVDPSGSRLLDAFTPPNQRSLNGQDQDLGSTGPAILPTVKQGSRIYHLMVQGGKGSACDSCSGTALFLLDRDNLSGHHAPGSLGGELQHLQSPGGCGVFAAPAVWKSGSEVWVFFATGCGVAGYRLSSPSPGTFRLSQRWFSRNGGSTPVLSKGVLYVASDGGVTAYNPSTGAVLTRVTGIGGVHWQYPLVTGTRLFISDQSGRLWAFALTP